MHFLALGYSDIDTFVFFLHVMHNVIFWLDHWGVDVSLFLRWGFTITDVRKLATAFFVALIALLLTRLFFVFFFSCLNWQGVSEVWRRDYNPSVLRIPTCPLPGMATFVTATKPNFRVTSTRDPVPLISYHTDGWTPAYSHNSLVSTATSHTHEMRASVIMKTSDVTSSWPLTPRWGSTTTASRT